MIYINSLTPLDKMNQKNWVNTKVGGICIVDIFNTVIRNIYDSRQKISVYLAWKGVPNPLVWIETIAQLPTSEVKQHHIFI